jgi:DNA-binding IclR family transcriptional regulator
MANSTKSIDRSRYRVPILDRTLALVELLGGCPEGLNVTELSEKLAIPKNSAFGIAVTLEENGYLERLEPSKRYRLTSKFMTFKRYTQDSELDAVGRTIRVAADVVSGRFGWKLSSLEA